MKKPGVFPLRMPFRRDIPIAELRICRSSEVPQYFREKPQECLQCVTNVANKRKHITMRYVGDWMTRNGKIQIVFECPLCHARAGLLLSTWQNIE